VKKLFVNKMRNLRLKYRITLTELAKGFGGSRTWLSKLELKEKAPPIVPTQQAIIRAFEEVIANRRSALYALERDFHLHKEKLFEQAEEGEPL
jgi:transcriptional regulator with XRE-family HTH domain